MTHRSRASTTGSPLEDDPPAEDACALLEPPCWEEAWEKEDAAEDARLAAADDEDGNADVDTPVAPVADIPAEDPLPEVPPPVPEDAAALDPADALLDVTAPPEPVLDELCCARELPVLPAAEEDADTLEDAREVPAAVDPEAAVEDALETPPLLPDEDT